MIAAPILIMLIWILYSTIEGKREAYYWHHWVNLPPRITNDVNLHPLFAQQRGIVIFIMSFLVISTHGFLISGLIGLANACIFSFFHNGMMYLTRNELNENNYPEKWWAQSSNSTAWSTKLMTPISRTIQMLIGTAIYSFVIYSAVNQ